MNKIIVTLIVLVVAVAGIAAWKYGAFGNNNGASMNQATAQPTDQGQSSTQADAATQSSQQAAQTITVIYGEGGFSPKDVTIHKGDTVKWINNDTDPLWVASGIHPTHTVYNGTSLSQHCPNPANAAFDECAGMVTGQNYSFTFLKIGSWPYHNHLSPSNTGTVVVQ